MAIVDDPSSTPVIGNSPHSPGDKRRRLLGGSDSTVPLSPLDEFKRLVEQWREETGMYSSISKKIEHLAYRRIVAMGESAIPWVLEELRDRPSYWFAALRELAKDLPNTPNQSGDFSAVRVVPLPGPGTGLEVKVPASIGKFNFVTVNRL